MSTHEDDDGMKIDDLLRFMVKQEASDLHLKPMRPPLLRLHGKLLPLKTDTLHPDLLKEMLAIGEQGPDGDNSRRLTLTVRQRGAV